MTPAEMAHHLYHELHLSEPPPPGRRGLLAYLRRAWSIKKLRSQCDHINNQCKGDWVLCNDCGETWLCEEEDD